MNINKSHRKSSGPLKLVASWAFWFKTAPLRIRTVILLVATCFLSYKFYLYGQQWLIAPLKEVSGLHRYFQVHSLIHFDILLFTIVAMIILCVLASGLINWNLPSVLKGHPVVAFLTASVGLVLLLSMIPTVFMDLWIPHETAGSRTWKNLMPNRIYLIEVLRFSFCMALFLADRASARNSIPWRTLPFLIPMPFFNSFPLLWLIALEAWLPSKYWKVWRPFAALSTCLLPIIVFPLAQPIQMGMPMFQQALSEQVCPEYGPGATGYEVVPIEGEGQFFIRIGDTINRAVKRTTGSWKCADGLQIPGSWNQAGFDFAGNKAYVFEVTSRTLYTLSLSPLSIISKTEIPFHEFPIKTVEPVRLGYDPVLHRLVVVTEDGFAVVFDVDEKKVLMDAMLLNDRGLTLQILISSDGSEVYVLRERGLYVFDLTNLKPLRHIAFTRVAAGMVFDEKEDSVWVSFPLDMEVVRFQRETLANVGVMDAPLGVRCLALDQQRRLLLMSSISGVIEIRDLQNSRRLSRTRVLPWIHWLAVLPKNGNVVVTGGGVGSIVWNYLFDSQKSDPGDFILEKSETFLKMALGEIRISGIPASSPGLSIEDPFHGHGRILVIEADDTERSHAVIILKRAEYDVISAKTMQAGLDILKHQTGKVDLVIVGNSLFSMSDKFSEAEFVRMHPDIPLLTSAFLDEVATVDNSPQTDIIKPFRYRETLLPVHGALATMKH
jgi:hypothetical protein